MGYKVLLETLSTFSHGKGIANINHFHICVIISVSNTPPS